MKRKISELRTNEGIHCENEIQFELISELFEKEGFRVEHNFFGVFKEQTVLLRNGNIQNLSHCIQDEKSIYAAADYLESPMDIYGKEVEVKKREEDEWHIGYKFVGICPTSGEPVVSKWQRDKELVYESFRYVRVIK